MCETITIDYTCGHIENVSWFHCPRGENYMGRYRCARECREPTPILRIPVHRRFCQQCRRRKDEGSCDGYPPPEERPEESREGVIGVRKGE
ncbi:hypothetical protein IMZ48_24735 [Candidatus Bathyarchaeota archaeon]|nr:hypothetical protein [Candidatus Bathyarchaeota archaeon]